MVYSYIAFDTTLKGAAHLKIDGVMVEYRNAGG